MSHQPKISIVTPTHNPKWLAELWLSVQSQTFSNWEWVISVNAQEGVRSHVETRATVSDIIRKGLPDLQKKVRIVTDPAPYRGIGARKAVAFAAARGEILVEVDHDDLLVPTALDEIVAAFAHPDVGFVYSDWADFDGRAPQDTQGRVTYRDLSRRQQWEQNGFTFYRAEIDGVRPGEYECVSAFAPSAKSFSLIFWAPNHVRAWRKDVYHSVGGHNPRYEICDDHELMVRTYLVTRVAKIAKPIYLARFSGENTWPSQSHIIERTTREIRDAYIRQLIYRQCKLDRQPVVLLRAPGQPGFESIGRTAPEGLHVHCVDLEKVTSLQLPYKHDSIGAFVADDFLQFYDKSNMMRALFQCLAPGGWLISRTPATRSAEAFGHPDIVSHWNESSFWHFIRPDLAATLDVNRAMGKAKILFQEQILREVLHKDAYYVEAILTALKVARDGDPTRDGR